MNDQIRNDHNRWYVLSFSASRFRSVYKYLDSLSAQWFCPEKIQLSPRAGRENSYIVRRIPLFPGYLFIRLDFNVLHPRQVCRFSHVRRFVTFGEEPVPISDAIIKYIKDREITESALPCKSMLIPQEFAEVLHMEDPSMRNYALLNYLASKKLKHAS